MPAAIVDNSPTTELSTRYLDPSWSRQIRSLLYHTYRDDPLFQHILDSERKGYLQRVRACTRELASSYFTENMPVIGLLDGDRLTGVAFVSCNEKADEVTNRFLWRARMLLSIGYGCTESYLNYHQNLSDSTNKSRSYLLPLVGVHPDYRQQGHGRRLLQAVHDLCDLDQESNGSVISLSDRSLLPFFNELGYSSHSTMSLGSFSQTLLFRTRPV